MLVRAQLLAVAATLVFSLPSLAQDDEEYPVDPTLTGLYVGGSIGAGWANFDTRGGFGTSVLPSLIVGYRGGEYVSIEGELEWLPGLGSGSREADLFMASLGFRVHMPIGQIEPYLTYGGGILSVNGPRTSLGRVNTSDFAIHGGGGVAYQWTDNVSLFAEGIYTWPISGVQGFDHGSVRFGLLYKFAPE